ncbi:squalene synthase isoform X3 [Notamacropus eugenii]|uniref:squalene synthase isoform X3 n=1 Tax=Notamacropus eugenii TaxID=9315 RepID=UPI003B66E17D
MAAACCTKAGALFKLTLGLTPSAAPRASGIGVGNSQRCYVVAFFPWTTRDWCRGEGVCYWPPTISRLPQPRASSTSTSTSSSTCLLCPQDALSDGLKTCYKYLNETSRSFAAVIQALDSELRNAVCIFYLVLRALDTVEDDMTINMEKKVPLLQNFHSYLYQPDWRYMESSQKDRQVLEDFSTVSLEFRNLAESYQVVISDICQKMGHGMAEFLEKKVTSVQEWDKVMAIATLAACYNNQQVFKGRVKIRKGQAVTLMMEATNMPAVKAIMYQYMEEIDQRIPSSDPSSSKTKQIISSVRKQNLPSCQLLSRNHYSPIYLSCAMLLVALSWQYLSTMSQATEEYVQTGEH